jgi:hypothetical protein
LLCNTALPTTIKVNPDQGCERLPQELLWREPQFFKSLEAAKKYVDEAKQKKRKGSLSLK